MDFHSSSKNWWKFRGKKMDNPLKFNFLQKKKKIFNIDLFKWLNFSKNKRHVKYRFLVFIFGVVDKNSCSNFYLEQLKEIYFQKKTSFYISFEHLVISDPLLSIWITDEPEIIFKIFKETCEEVLENIFRKNNQKFVVPIRLHGLPSYESMRNLKNKRPNCLIKVKGYVISKTQIFPTIGFFHLTCLKCFEVQDVLFSTVDQKLKKIKNCFNCKSVGPFQTRWDKMITNNFQKISLREDFHKNSLRWIPYTLEIILTGDLIDYVEYGDLIEVIGILKYNILQKLTNTKIYPSFLIFVEGNCIQKINSLGNRLKISSFEIEIFENVTSEKKLLSYLLNSFIPDIFQNYFLKLSVLITFCSSGRKEPPLINKTRNSINMLLFGDHCTGKSKILKSVSNFLPNSHLLDGQGSSIKGLTASLKHDKLVGQWSLEGGLITLIKEGLWLINGLEDMGSTNIMALCKILDQQYVSLNQKSSIKNLLVQNSTIATINNLSSIKNPSLPFFLNYGLGEPFLSKFDIIHRIEKIGNFEDEKKYAKFLLEKMKNLEKNSNIFTINLKKNEMLNKPQYFSENFLRRYLDYCRSNIVPSFGVLDQAFILKFYVDLKYETRSLNTISFSSNFLETIIRIVSSSAKIHLRSHVSEKDLVIGLTIFFDSWTQLQPHVTNRFLKSKYMKFFNNLFNKFHDCRIFFSKI